MCSDIWLRRKRKNVVVNKERFGKKEKIRKSGSLFLIFSPVGKVL
jgi:hypothetical protein